MISIQNLLNIVCTESIQGHRPKTKRVKWQWWHKWFAWVYSSEKRPLPPIKYKG